MIHMFHSKNVRAQFFMKTLRANILGGKSVSCVSKSSGISVEKVKKKFNYNFLSELLKAFHMTCTKGTQHSRHRSRGTLTPSSDPSLGFISTKAGFVSDRLASITVCCCCTIYLDLAKIIITWLVCL